MIDKVSILGVEYKIREVPEGLDSGALGEIHECKSEIRIRDNLSPQCQVATLVHEILHACLWSINLDSSEEVVIPLSSVLFSVLLRENPKLISQLQAILAKGEKTHVSKKLPRKCSRNRRRP